MVAEAYGTTFNHRGEDQQGESIAPLVVDPRAEASFFGRSTVAEAHATSIWDSPSSGRVDFDMAYIHDALPRSTSSDTNAVWTYSFLTDEAVGLVLDYDTQAGVVGNPLVYGTGFWLFLDGKAKSLSPNSGRIEGWTMEPGFHRLEIGCPSGCFKTRSDIGAIFRAFNHGSFQWSLTPIVVPEPVTSVHLALGLVVLALRRRLNARDSIGVGSRDR